NLADQVAGYRPVGKCAYGLTRIDRGIDKLGTFARGNAIQYRGRHVGQDSRIHFETRLSVMAASTKDQATIAHPVRQLVNKFHLVANPNKYPYYGIYPFTYFDACLSIGSTSR